MTNCSGRKLKEIGEQGPVYRRAVLQAKHIESLWDPTTLLTRAEHEFIKKCEAAKTPFQDYTKAAVSHALKHFDYTLFIKRSKMCISASSSLHWGYPRRFGAPEEGKWESICWRSISISEFPVSHIQRRRPTIHDTDLSIGVELLKTLKANNFFSRELRRCRGHIRRFLSNHRWRDLHLSWANQGRPSLCPNRESHQRRRIKDEWLHEEETDECLACDVDREAEFVLSFLP